MNKCLLISIFIGILGFTSSMADSNVVNTLPPNLLIAPTLHQNAFAYTPKGLPLNKQLLSQAQQQQFHKQFMHRFFYPWSKENNSNEFCITSDGENCLPVLKFVKHNVKHFLEKPGYNPYYSQYPLSWIQSLVANMDLDTFPNVTCDNPDHNCLGITVKNALIRSMPTLKHDYASILIPGEGYPFDNMQESNLWLGTPVRILQKSKDGKWLLIKGPGLLGWVRSAAIAPVSQQFIYQWMHNKFVTPIQRQVTLYSDASHQETLKLYIGSLLPLVKANTDYDTVLIPVKNAQGQATTKTVKISTQIVSRWPLQPTPENFNRIINQFLGMTYGWGGIGFDTDCSGTLRRLFFTFGIMLPRNSRSQADYGGRIYPLPLVKYSPEKRKAMIIDGEESTLPTLKPYLTLISFGKKSTRIGHIALYLGKYPQDKPNSIVIFQSVWGVHLMKGNQDIGRAIIGKAVISKMNIGEHLNTHQKALTVQTLWDVPGLNITDMTQKPDLDLVKKLDRERKQLALS